jgi:osmotically-inducible protein OsmY
MRNELPLFALSLVLSTGMAFAGPPTIDNQTMEGVQSRLDRAKVNQHGDVQVTVDRGVATLTGAVDSLQTKMDAENAARKTKGVTRLWTIFVSRRRVWMTNRS